MNCSKIRPQLSAYYDGELKGAEELAVKTHLATCAACATDVADFARISELRALLVEPQAPPGQWEELARALEASAENFVAPVPFESQRPRLSHRFLAIAAAVLILAGVGVLSVSDWPEGGEHNHLAANFNVYLANFADNPETAHHILLDQYEGRPTTLQNAVASLQYEPAIAEKLPAGCTLGDVYMLNMPCCPCAMAICRCGDGPPVAVFEHLVDQPIWFGDRPKIDCLCDGKPTSIVQMGDRLAATWKRGTRYVTIIGARDLEQVTHFVASLGDSESSG